MIVSSSMSRSLPHSTTNNIDNTKYSSSHHKMIAYTFNSVSCCTCECIIPAEQDPGLLTPVYSLFRIYTALYIQFRFIYTSFCTSYYTTLSLMSLKRDHFLVYISRNFVHRFKYKTLYFTTSI